MKKVGYPYILKDSFIQITLPKIGSFSLVKSHPTFSQLKQAIKKKQWSKVSKLVSVAQTIYDQSHGEIEVKGGKVYYKGNEIHNNLTKRMVDMVKEGKKIKHYALFLENLQQNPSEDAKNHFCDWFANSDLPLTDSGEFLCYKSVDHNYKDKYTHTIDNHPGQVIMMSRKTADTDYDEQCSTGFHVCSKQYGKYGAKEMAVRINPRHVLSAVGGKMRVTQYEVLMELGYRKDDLFTLEGYPQLEKKLVIEIKKERKELLKSLLSSQRVKRQFRKKKLSKKTLLKANYARLKKMLETYGLTSVKKIQKIGPEDSRFLESARKAAGLSIGQISKESGLSYKTVALLEKKKDPSQDKVDSVLEAIAYLTKSSGVTYPKPVVKF